MATEPTGINRPADAQEAVREAMRSQSAEEYNRRQQQQRIINRNRFIRVVIVCCIVVGVPLIKHYYSDIKQWFNKQESTVSQLTAPSSSQRAIDAAYDLLEKNLTSPATAQKISGEVVAKQPPYYLVHLVVDSQNEFAATVRTSALVSVELVGSGQQFKYNVLTAIQESSNPPLGIEIELVKQLNGWPGTIKQPEQNASSAPEPDSTRQPALESESEPERQPSSSPTTMPSGKSESSGASPEVDRDWLIVPGESIGRTKLGMTRDDLIKRLGKPTEENEEMMTYKSKNNYVSLYLDNGVIVQIEFTSPSFRTMGGSTTRHVEQDADGFQASEFQWRFLQQRYDRKDGGLTFITFNADVPDDNPEYESYTRGYVYAGNHMPYEPISDAEWTPVQQ
jgi:hypothetical protein